MSEPERIGPYRLIRPLGAGGMGEVFLARDERLDRQVAIKRLRTSSEDSDQRRERFRREARITARLEHPAIVRIHDVLRDGEVDCIVMEYVDGENLRQRLDAGPLSLHEVLAIARQIALAMAEAHDQGIIHRDLKSENVLLTRAGQVKITDFGIAKDLRDETLTADGHVVGTYRAMSPEQALGRPLDHRSDLFSFGVLLYEALAGTSPFRAETPFLTLNRVVHAKQRAIRKLVPALPGALAVLIEQLLEKEPLLRPRNFHEVASALAEIQGEIKGTQCLRACTPGDPPQDSGGEGPGTEEPGTPPATSLALAATGMGPTPSETRAATPRARRDVGTGIALAATDPQTPATTPEPATREQVPAPAEAPGPAAPESDSRPGDQGASAVLPRARAALARRHVRRAVPLAVAGVVAVLGLVAWLGRDGGSTRILVAVPRHAVHAPPELSSHDLLAAAVRAAIVRGLLDIEGIAPLPLDDIDIVTEGFEREHRTLPRQHELARLVGAHELCTARLECTLQLCRVSLERLASDGSLREATTFEVAPDDIRGSDEAVRVRLSRLYPDHRVDDESAAPQMDPADHEEFLRLRAAFWEDTQPVPTNELIDRLDAIRARTRGAIDVHRFQAEVLQYRYAETEDARYLERASEVLRAAEAQGGDSHELLLHRFEIALLSRQDKDAEDTLRRIEALDPGSGTTLRLRGRWYARTGQREKALELLQRAVAVDSSWRNLYYLATVERGLGEIEEAQSRLDQLLARSPGNRAALSLRALIEQHHGNPACALELYRELIARKPQYHDCVNRGTAEAVLGLYDDAARSFQCALKARPGDVLASFNLAESLKLAGDTAAATREFWRLLDELQQRGKRTLHERKSEAQALAHLAESDPTLADRTRVALALMLEEIAQSASEKAGSVYEAAVVHALLGEHERAAEHVLALLDQGKPPNWFRFPWFDGVRQDPTLRERLAYQPLVGTCDPAARRPNVR
jgi:tRNA A-37 threonylcarbamoyl transferase component Bud32/tetratricopeptide (TPR) repeat protein